MDEPRVRDKRPLRQRVSKACDSCRSRKDRCDARVPSCSSCLKLGRTCSYNTQSKKRGLREGYVRGLEKLWALALRRIPGLEEQLIAILREATQIDSQNRFTGEWFELDEERSLLRTWKDSSLLREFEEISELLERLPEKSSKKDPAAPSSSGSTAGRNPDSSISRTIHARALAAALPLGGGNDPRKVSSKFTSDRGDASEPAALERLQVPTTSWHLIELFFSYTHCWFPVLSKHHVTRILYQYSNDNSSQRDSQNSTGAQAVLWALLGYADVQYSTLKAAQSGDVPIHSEPGWQSMYERARSLIPIDSDKLDMFHIQALLLLILTDMHRGRWKRAWIDIGYAARVALMLDVDRDALPDNTESSSGQDSRWSHVLFGCFLLDSLISARVGQAPQLRESNIQNTKPVDESGLEQWEPWKDSSGAASGNTSMMQGPSFGSSIYNHLVRITRFLNRSLNNREEGQSFDRSRSLFNSLRDWSQQNIFFVHMDQSIRHQAHIKHPLLPHQIHLRLAYVSSLLRFSVSLESLFSPPQLEYAIGLAGQGCRLVEKHALFFGYGTIPPTYELFSNIICDFLDTMQQRGVCVAQIRGDLRDMKDTTSDIAIVWPEFQSVTDRFHKIFDSLITRGPPSAPRSLSRAPSGSARMYDSLASGTEEASPDSVFIGTGSSLPSSNQTHSQSPWQIQAPDSGDLNALGNPGLGDSAESIDVSNMTDPGTVAASDVDSILQDFAAVDAMEWMNNFDESLSHLGFADGTSMNQEFQAFWQNMRG